MSDKYEIIPSESFITGNLNTWYYDIDNQLIIVLMQDGIRTVIDSSNSHLLCYYLFKPCYINNRNHAVLETVDGSERILLSNKIIGKAIFDDEYVRHKNEDTLDNRRSNLTIVKLCRIVYPVIDGVEYNDNQHHFFIRTTSKEGKESRTTFSCSKYGFKQAFKLAAYHKLALDMKSNEFDFSTLKNNPHDVIKSAADKLPYDPSIIRVRNGITYTIVNEKQHIVHIANGISGTDGTTTYQIIVNDESDVRLIAGSEVIVDTRTDKLLINRNGKFVEFSRVIFSNQMLIGDDDIIVHLNCNTFDIRLSNLIVLRNGEKIKELNSLRCISEQSAKGKMYLLYKLQRNKSILCKRLFGVRHDKSDYKYSLSKLMMMNYHASKIFNDIDITKNGIIDFITHFDDYGYSINMNDFIRELDYIDIITSGYSRLSVKERIERECRGGSHPFFTVHNALRYDDSKNKLNDKHKKAIEYVSKKFNESKKE